VLFFCVFFAHQINHYATYGNRELLYCFRVVLSGSGLNVVVMTMDGKLKKILQLIKKVLYLKITSVLVLCHYGSMPRRR